MNKITFHHPILLVLLCLAVLFLNACDVSNLIPGVSQSTAVASGTPVVNLQATTQPQPTATSTQVVVPTRVATSGVAPIGSLIIADLKNATYESPDFLSMGGNSASITLVNGQYSFTNPKISSDQPAFTVQYLQGAIGDLNGDGQPDAAVILVANTGGSGAFEYLAAVIQAKGAPRNVDTILLGDRIKIESMVIQNGLIDLQVITHGPQDPMCCPSVKTSETYLLDGSHLVTQAEKITAPLANGVIQALKTKNMVKLVSYVNPSAGVRFSPYTNVKTNDLVFTAQQLTGAFNDPSSYLWGNFDGSGAPIQLTFADYYTRFVYSSDFTSAKQVGYNVGLSSGNMIDNSHDFYPDAIIVEYYLPGTDPKYGGMDWQSLKLVFQQIPSSSNSLWYLVGIIHSQWTI